jgi:THAP4-like, heme-binding beta-barrel domain
MSGPDLHPDVAPLAFLLGSWIGEGAGHYPTIEDFTYGEEIRVSHVGKPFLAYTQRTWSLDDGRPLHAESGYWRLVGGTRVELVIAHPTGVVEVEEGELSGTSVSLATTATATTGSAKDVERLTRDVRVRHDELAYDLQMAAVGQPLQPHLRARLTRTGT